MPGDASPPKRQPRHFPTAEERRDWIVAAAQRGKTGADIAREIGLSRTRVAVILSRERERRRLAAESKRGRLAAKGDPASLQVRYLKLSAYTKNPLLARYGQDVTLGELANEPNLILGVNGFGPAGAAELAAVMKARGIEQQFYPRANWRRL